MAINFDLTSLNGVELKDISVAPFPVRAAVLAVVFLLTIIAGYWFVWSSQLSMLSADKQQELSLRQEFLEKKREAVNLDAYRQQLAEINHAFGALLRELPDKSQVAALLTDINEAGLGRGLKFDLFKPGAETLKDFYAVMPISIKVSGNYHDFGAFASDIAQLSRIATLKDISVAPNKDGTLTMNATIETYRYLDEAEIAAQQPKKGKRVK